MVPDSTKPAFKRVLLKISGEALMGSDNYGLNSEAIKSICKQVKEVKELGVEIALVVGGGNIFRGLRASERGMDRVTADNMGMLATVINCLALMDKIEGMGVKTRVMSAVKIEDFAEPYIRRRAVRHMEKGRLVILAAGTGNPYFSTDTAAALRAMEVGAELLIKATQVDGIYSADPKVNPDAVFYPNLTYKEVLDKQLRVMDITAVSLLMDNHIPVRIVAIKAPDVLKRVVMGEVVGSLIS